MPERKTQNEDLFHWGSSANLPRLHTCENKVPFWDFSQFAVTTATDLPARHSGYWRWNKDILISNVLQWTPTHRHTRVGWPTKTYIHQLYADTGCHLKDLPRVMADWDGWQEKELKQSILPVCLDPHHLKFIVLYTSWIVCN